MDDSEKNMEVETPFVSSSSSWSELPDGIIEKIYSFLDRHNQSNMSIVCHRWAELYGSASVWRSMKFHLPPKYDCQSEIYPEVRSAKNYGTLFRDVEITFDRVEALDPDCGKYWEQLCLFLVTLIEHKSQLRSLSFMNMAIFYKNLENVDVTPLFHAQSRLVKVINELIVSQNILSDELSEVIRNLEDVNVMPVLDAKRILFEVIKNLIVSQDHLINLELAYSLFKTSEAVDLLRIICTKNTLEDLMLVGFIDESEDDQISGHIFGDGSDLENFMNLDLWGLEYSRIFEIIMTKFYDYGKQSYMNGKKLKLHEMQLICNMSTAEYSGIPEEIWEYIAKVCPDFKIDMTLTVCDTEQLRFFITRFMPITAVYFMRDVYEPETGLVLEHLVECGININLEKLSINCFPQTINLHSYLNRQDFPKLTDLHLYMVHPIDGLHALFEYWLEVENRPESLKTVSITSTNSSVDEDDMDERFSELANTFVPAFERQKLALNFTCV